MSRLWIKICGITRPEDAIAAADLGANALGFVFYPPSSRALEVQRLHEILAGVPTTIQRVALFVDPDTSQVEAVLKTGLIDRLQFHGGETGAFCASFGVPYFKALRVAPGFDVKTSLQVYATAERVFLDAFDNKAPGGTGKTFDWSIAAAAVEAGERRLVLAGGLSPDNVAAAVRQVRPAGVDVSTGVEDAPGIKNVDKIENFIEEANRGNDRA